MIYGVVLYAICTIGVAAYTHADDIYNISSWKANDGGYEQYIIEQWAKGQTGNVGGVVVTSGGAFATAVAPGATVSFDMDTVFEVGSTTKTFTTLVAELLVLEGKLSMTDTIGQHLPSNVVLSPAVTAITLEQLATHTSGLTRMPDNTHGDSPSAMGNYTVDDLYAYLSSLHTLGPKKFLYSNTGFGVLGWVTCLVTGKGWEEVVKEMVLDPLALNDTSVRLSPSQQARFAPPFAQGKPTGPTTFLDSMVGAGGLRSTATDMIRYTTAFAGGGGVEVPVVIRKAMDRMLVAKAADEFADLRGEVDEAFQQYSARGQTVVWKDGATSGFNCMINFGPSGATVVLANTAALSAATSVSLTAALVAVGPPKHHTPIPVPIQVLMSYQGAFSSPASAHNGPITYQVVVDQTALSIESATAPVVVVEPFAKSSFFALQQYLEAYCGEENGQTLVMFFGGQDHYASRPKSNTSTTITTTITTTPTRAFTDWLVTRSFKAMA